MASLTKNEIAEAINEMTEDRFDGGIDKPTIKAVIDTLGVLATEELGAGNDFNIPGLVKFSYRYTKPLKKGENYKKGDTYTGFGGVETVAEEDSKARKAKVKLVATPATQVKEHMPKSTDAAGMAAFLKSKPGKNIVATKG